MLSQRAAATPPQPATAYQITPDHRGVGEVTGDLVFPSTALWTISLPGLISYPLIVDGRVFVTVVNVNKAVANANKYGTLLYAFDARTGKTLWGPIAISGTYFWSNATYADGAVYVVNFDGVLMSFDAATGAAGWSVQLPGQGAFSSPPTAYEGFVYVGGAGVGGTVYSVDEKNGAVVWTENVENGDNSSPAVAKDGVFVSYVCPQVYDFVPTTGHPLWHYSGLCEGGGGKTPVLNDGKLYVRDPISSPTGYIFEAKSGALLGRFSAGPAPAITDTRGYFLNDGTLQGVDLSTLAVLWSFAGAGGLVTAPIVVGPVVFIGSSDGTLYAVEGKSGKQVWSITGPAINGPDEQDVTQPLTGLAVADRLLIVPAGKSLSAYAISKPTP
jgi:outer membrane protein assembly factor BamB